MDWSAVSATLAALPRTFQRSGPNFAAYQNSVIAALSEFTSGVDSLVAQSVGASGASGKWLDVWGEALGLPRQPGESRSTYLGRINAMCALPRGTVPAIETYMQLVANLSVTVTENFPSVGWTMTLSSASALQNAVALETGLGAVRPAGVPYSLVVQQGGSFLSTSNFFGRSRAKGSYLTSQSHGLSPSVAPNTNNVVVELPMTFLTDPTLNPAS